MHKYSYIAILFFNVLLAGCSSIQPVYLDQLQAADISFPEQIKSVGVVTISDYKTKVDSKQVAYKVKGNTKLGVQTMAKRIADANYFDRVVVCDSTINIQFNAPLSTDSFKHEVMTNVMNDLNVDMIFCLDSINIDLYKIDNSILGLPYDALEGIVTPYIQMYVTSRKSPLYIVQKTDSLFWDITPRLNINDIVDDASEYIVSKPIDNILPHWKEIVRFYYDGDNVEMRDAGVNVRNNEWNEAYKLWKQVYETKKGKMKMKSAFNIAVYNESKDNIKEALEWLDKSESLAKKDSEDLVLIVKYRSELLKRSNDLLKLNIQMSRFIDKKIE